MSNIEISFRFKTDPEERPDQSEIVPEHEREAFRVEIIGHGGFITGEREVGWREMLAHHENSHEL